MKKLTTLFDRVYVINCPHRPDRLDRVTRHLLEEELVDIDKVVFYPAVIGDVTSHPAGWGAGNGAWGCLRSHQRIMEDAMHHCDDRWRISWDQILILEDDVVFLEGALERLNEFMAQVPSDWGQIYLGGQHQKRPERTDVEGILRGMSVNRTHAYALHREAIHMVYRHVCYMPDYQGTNKHIDHQLELAHNRKDWNVYCPVEWFCGQEAGESNVSGATNERMIWEHNYR